MNRSKLIAIVTGAISLIIATAYLMLVQLLDFRGEMIPAPVSLLSQPTLATPAIVNLKELSSLEDLGIS